MLRLRPFLVTLCALATACGGKPKTMPEPPAHALAGLSAQPVAVLPTYIVNTVPGSPMAATLGRPADVKKTLDADILAALDERGLRKVWLLPPDLEQSYKRNSTYAANPYGLAEEPLRSPVLKLGDRLPEPLASQVRTLVALHADVRMVLAPVELRLEAADSTGMAQAVLRLVLLDARMSNVRWIGEIRSDPAKTFGPRVTATIASKLADVMSAE